MEEEASVNVLVTDQLKAEGIIETQGLCSHHQGHDLDPIIWGRGIVIYNNKYILGFGPYSWHKTPKTFRISCDKSHKAVLGYVNEETGKNL